MLLNKLEKLGIIKPPDFLISNTHYLTLMGSHAYQVWTKDSDYDIYGFCIPKKEIIFPHTAGYIAGFGTKPNGFEQWLASHVIDPNTDKEYDITVYNIIKYFQLVMENNPNMIDSLFTSEDCVLHATQIGRLVRDNRHIFLHKGCWHKFRGYSFAQWKKIKKEHPIGKRAELVEKYGWDIKFGYHLIRLLDECVEILEEGNLTLGRNAEYYKAIRAGAIPLTEVEKRFYALQETLEKLYHESKLQYQPDESKIKNLLLKCLEIHYGSLDKCIVQVGKEEEILRKIKELVKDY